MQIASRQTQAQRMPAQAARQCSGLVLITRRRGQFEQHLDGVGLQQLTDLRSCAASHIRGSVSRLVTSARPRADERTQPVRS